MSIQITKEKFDEYEAVRQSGAYNMFDPQARAMTNLSKREWATIISEYNKLAKAWLNNEDNG